MESSPFTCCQPSDNFEQVYSASAFPGPITVTGLEFFNTRYDSHATYFGSGSMFDGHGTADNLR